DSIKLCADRTASLTAARIMSSSISRSLGSIAFGSILICLISPVPFATTVIIPPPAVASTVSFASSSCALCICSCIWPICCMSLLMSMSIGSILSFARVQGLFDQLEDLLLARGFVVRFRVVCPRFALGERDAEMAAGHLVEGFGKQRRVLWLFGELPVECGARGKLDGQCVVGQVGGLGLSQHGCRGNRAFLDRRHDRPLPRLLELLQLERGRSRRRDALVTLPWRFRIGAWHRSVARGDMAPTLELLEAVGD